MVDLPRVDLLRTPFTVEKRLEPNAFAVARIGRYSQAALAHVESPLLLGVRKPRVRILCMCFPRDGRDSWRGSPKQASRSPSVMPGRESA